MGLFASSARNMIPRFVSSLTVMAVCGVYVSWAFAIAWMAAVCATLVVGLKLANAMQRAGRSRHLGRWVVVNSGVATLTQVAATVALWRTGDPSVGLFGFVTAFIGSVYILLQYYSDLLAFRLLLAPYALAMTYMVGDLALRNGVKPGVVVVLVSIVFAMANFFWLARKQLDRSRTSLRKARQRAESGEQAAEAANSAKSAFLATMSHEIRTPLNGVLGMAQAMAGDKLTPVQRDRLSVIHRSGEALLAILNDVLDLSKIEAGKLELEAIPFDLTEVARGTYSAFTALANKKGLSFALDIDRAKGRYLGDPTRLRQILYNLISNALKFTDHGEIRVTAIRDGEILEIAVADSGCGIAPENLPKLFSKFDQLDSSTTRRFGGTGLGLAICRDLAELMGGKIEVESRLGEGARFTIRLPLTYLGEEKPAAESLPAPPPELRSSGLRVLAAEDNTVNQLVLKTMLHQLGVEPVVVDNGAAAVEAWETGAWDVILMDIQMPGMDGLMASSHIRRAEARTGRPRTPIIALTANAMSHQVEQYLAAGMDGHVAKPIEATTLFEALCQATNPPEAGEPDRAKGAA
jgi:signal transduction histidine kinase/ActR/RegA family two-component response regulator